MLCSENALNAKCFDELNKLVFFKCYQPEYFPRVLIKRESLCNAICTNNKTSIAMIDIKLICLLLF